IYPCTEAECNEMDSLLRQADDALMNKNDDFYHERRNELQDIVDWSRKKHWTFKWSLIAGCVLSIFIMMYISEDASGDKRTVQQKSEQVKAWAPMEITVPFEQCVGKELYNGYDRTNANTYKVDYLRDQKGHYLYEQQQIAQEQESLAKAETKEKKKECESYIEACQKRAESYKEEYDRVNKMEFKEFQKMALKIEKEGLGSARVWAAFMWIVFVYVILLIPLYIHSSHQFGYNITRHRAEARMLDKIQKVGFGIASFLLGSSLALAFFPETKVTTHYSDGRKTTHTESNPLDIIILVLKMVLLAVAAIVFCIVSVFIMSYVTIMAFKRDHDWSKVAAVTKKGVNMAVKAGQKVGAKASKN
ncbi:MAG: hypothetical protein K2H65_04750, partial [Bacteroidales bacterium]|nr:hypothetical protein [Bacteroidales bacterium]